MLRPFAFVTIEQLGNTASGIMNCGGPRIKASAKPNPGRVLLPIAILALIGGLAFGAESASVSHRQDTQSDGDQWLGPAAMAFSLDGRQLFIACASAHAVAVFDVAKAKLIHKYKVPATPSGLAIAHGRLYVTCAAAESILCEIDLLKGLSAAECKTGHTALSPVLSPDTRFLYFCLKFNDEVVVWNTQSRREEKRIAVGREPISIALTADGKLLLVAHHLPSGRADAPIVSASIGVVDLESGLMTRQLPLPNGSSLVREIRISPDGRFAAVAHNLAHFQVPTTQLDRGWMNTSVLTLLDVESTKVINTVVLDEVDRGAANPWAVAWSPGGQQLFVTHAGTHDLSVIDFPALLAKLNSPPPPSAGERSAPAEDLSFLVGLRQRIKLGGNGPRSLVVGGDRAYAAGYFSDSLDIVDVSSQGPRRSETIALHRVSKRTPEQEGERIFNDASICFQGWQSCASCHSEDARVDGLNWDLLNDGLGNPKNARSLLLAHRTPPAMSMGVRYSAEEAVRAGLRHILFAEPSEALATPLDSWLKSLQPMASPHLIKGKLSPAAKRGQRLFNSSHAGCANCHTPGLFTDLNSYDVGTAGPMDQKDQQFDTPTLVELWRTAPYLHDGSAATLRDVLTTRNNADQHGQTSRLSERELDDLIQYLLSL